ncbi:GvpL/GvpF family gas vesicle protein [Streptomyces sp. DSM 42041]|uniref:GvpL/GvpF family gas vesicle protein n=1 Tax=Streptomyces hazeniae TaxID=3075538 RepID=A0ABU2NZ98_9ACTN|nr:GvpL/GvpF family gas vesicle protein [Streptomyces sp. DSM 42041]MDT0382084.1 GvpL/GvpF family gas vesicle protein [Streptomyces sp. DSM 42041]
MTEPALLSYVYAIGRCHSLAELPTGLADLTGIGEAHIRVVGAHALAAVVSSVPAEEFDDEGFRAQLEDLTRLETVARAHHAVVDSVAGRATVLPLRLATVYRDDAGVARMLHEAEDRFCALLDRLDGRAEWGVKVYASPDAAPRADESVTAPGSAPAGAEDLSPGRAYLRQRKAQRSRHQDAFQAAADTVERIAALAEAYAAEGVPHRPQSGELATGEGENISNVSYLVPHDRGEDFRAEAEAAAREAGGVRVEVTGPWAPYSFAEAPPAPTLEGSGGR